MLYTIDMLFQLSPLPLSNLSFPFTVQFLIYTTYSKFFIVYSLSPTRYLHLISCRLRITVTFFNLFCFCFVFVLYFFFNIICSYFSILLFLFLYSSGVCFGLFCYFRTVNLLLFDYRRHAYRYVCVSVCVCVSSQK